MRRNLYMSTPSQRRDGKRTRVIVTRHLVVNITSRDYNHGSNHNVRIYDRVSNAWLGYGAAANVRDAVSLAASNARAYARQLDRAGLYVPHGLRRPA